MTLAAKALDLILPPLCLACDARVGQHGALCPGCWSGLQFIASPLCSGCGAPFDVTGSEGQLCAPCISAPPHYTMGRSAVIYDDASKKLILGFKHGDRSYMARTLASWMYRAGQDVFLGANLLVPIPLHRWRLFKRRYNQAALLAQNLAQLSNIPVLIDALARAKATVSQGHMNRKERAANLRDAFHVPAQHAATIKNKTILLVDDVLTTGSTLNEAADTLLKAGATKVHTLTFARVRSLV